jgi:hypothetical protein
VIGGPGKRCARRGWATARSWLTSTLTDLADTTVAAVAVEAVTEAFDKIRTRLGNPIRCQMHRGPTRVLAQLPSD